MWGDGQLTFVEQPDPVVALTIPLEFIIGGTLSTTVTSNEQVADSPDAVVAVYVTVVVPRVKTDPEFLFVVRVAPPQLSETVGAFQLTRASQFAFALAVIFVGHPDIVGAMLSTTVTLKEQVAIFPAASVAV
jgi:hypothetical protein